jgi:diguanylate cyclase (GGDEF)-like protein
MSPTAFGYAVLAFLALGLAFAFLALRRGYAFLASGLDAAREKALEALGAGMIVVSARGRVSVCNAEARLLLGVGDAPGYRVLAALRAAPELASLLVAGEGGADLSLGESSDRRRIEARAFPFGRVGKGTVLLLRDVTENAALLEELSAMASQDPLTGIYNRRRFDELGERDIELSRRAGNSVGVLMMDIDLFKRVNDERGHAVGDEVLKAVCGACRDALRSSDVLARYGGEEFAVLLPGSGQEDCVLVAERLRTKIAAVRVPYEGGAVSVTVSLGAYAAVPSPGDGLGLYLRRADEAMYRSKALGRDRVSFWEALVKEAKN